MNILSNAVKCVNCKKVLESPVLLPCSHSICRKHTLDAKGSSIFCNKCGNEHTIPQISGFPHNEALADIISAQIATLDLGLGHNEAKQSCATLDELLTKIEQILQDPFNFTYEAINYLKNVVQLKGEEMKFKIDEKMNGLIGKLEDYKQECKKGLSTAEYVEKSEALGRDKDVARDELEKWEDILNEIKVNEQEWRRIKSESEKAIVIFETKLVEFKVDLFPKRFQELRDEIEKEFGKFKLSPEFNFE